MILDLGFKSFKLPIEAIPERVHLIFFIIDIDEILSAIDLKLWVKFLFLKLLNAFRV
jgi:hypothetical protein